MSHMQNARPAANGTGEGTAGEHVESTIPSDVSTWQRSGGRPDVTAARPGRPVGHIASVISQQPWWRRGTPEQRRKVVAAIQEARRRAHDRKARVRAHPDIAERLRSSLGYVRFDQWGGYVPTEHGPVRAELIAILHQVAEREKVTA